MSNRGAYYQYDGQEFIRVNKVSIPAGIEVKPLPHDAFSKKRKG